MSKDSRLSKNALYVLVGVQAVLAFVLGVVGNRVAELINVSPRLLLAITILLMLLSLAITIVLSRYEISTRNLGQKSLFPTPSFNERLSRLLLNRIVTIFPLGIVTGALVSSIFAVFLPVIGIRIGIPISELSFIHSYEVVSYLVAFVTLFFVSRSRRDLSLILSYALGFAISVTGVFIILRPEENEFYLTFFGWSVVLMLGGLVMRSRTVEALYNDISAIVKDLVRDRAN